MSDYPSWQLVVWQLCLDVAKEAFERMSVQYDAVYLYYTPGGKAFGKLHAVVYGLEPPEGAELAWNERLPRNITFEALARKIETIARRLPILPH